MNNNNSIKTTSKIKYNGFERRVSPFFNSLPHDVPVDWLIPFLMVFEDLQYLQYIINNKSFPNIRKWVLNIYALFNPDITNNVFL
ncbi:hypothetical protein BCR36DRAFT_39632 [Piromyces finnis]|uniref:Uncharacterized protein n=1 Tax=Piromyces finnis TaxID=1754191 RepID=A0A1Y1UAY4_9FUNG|nr:hypothetical protein BCR36DRAFT_39632 [Piromyces finnis]|eukprot:ORX35193.1 hypothetical protein BCR36DRAFT_39632 [Piromyces finnis]